jgi:hypothetical protein
MKFSKVFFRLGIAVGLFAVLLPRIGRTWMYANTMADVMWWSAVAAISLIVLSLILRLVGR